MTDGDTSEESQEVAQGVKKIETAIRGTGMIKGVITDDHQGAAQDHLLELIIEY